jgi:transcriptional regulator with XRE-family HTH domain
MSNLGTRIRDYRKLLDLTQEQLVARMQVRGHGTLTQPRQAEIENGIRDVSVAELVSYARVLGVAITELLDVPDRE